MNLKMMFLVGFALATVAVAMGDNTKAMQECQQRHSYDTCFYALNR